ncbi:MAG TPA: carboxymuconolactone decarboxylase family protein [Acidimicrobiales bacterium]|nr:carboxymuconolactone decarboxylase family protein [Acidimicrobiales bacterium]
MTDSHRRFGALPVEEMSPRQREVATAILSGPRSRSTGLSGPFEALLRSPDLADPVQRVGEHVRFHSSLPPRLNELAILLTARKWSAQYEWYAHRRMALAAGLDPSVADAIARNDHPVGLDGDAAAVYRFAGQLLATGGVDDQTFAGVRDRFGEEGAADLVGVVGYYCLVSFFLNVDRYPVPEGEGLPGPA